MNAKAASVEPLLPVELGPGKIKFAQGMKAGRWVFANGLMGQDFVNGIDPDVLSERMPHGGLPKREKEAARLFKNLDAVLKAGEPWVERIRGLRANASRRSHAELDQSSDLDAGDPVELGSQYRELRRRLPQLAVLGGCCGTDHRHIDAIRHACVHGHEALEVVAARA